MSDDLCDRVMRGDFPADPKTIARPVNGAARKEHMQSSADTDGSSEADTARPAAAPTTVASVLERWRAEGPLVHEPTGIAALDDLTDGGPVYGTRWFVLGAPDAGKTALLVQIAHTYAERGICVGVLAVDEEDGDLVTRLAQRVGYSRSACELRDATMLSDMEQTLGQPSIRFYDDRWTIESAAADLAQWAAAEGQHAMLMVDSLQTVQCDAELLAERPMAEVSAVTARVRAIRYVASTYRLIAIATSEMGRGGYASRDPSQRTSALASGKWSGAIEFQGRVVLAVTNVPGESDLLDIEVAKNKHGPRSSPSDPTTAHVFLRIDRRSQTLREVDYEPPPDDRVARRAEEARAQVNTDADGVMVIIEAQSGIETRDLYAAAKATLGIGRYRVDAAVSELGARVQRLPGPRGSKRHYSEGSAP